MGRSDWSIWVRTTSLIRSIFLCDNIFGFFEFDLSLTYDKQGLAVDMSEGPRWLHQFSISFLYNFPSLARANSHKHRYGTVGSPLWMAPEMIRGDIYTYRHTHLPALITLINSLSFSLTFSLSLSLFLFFFSFSSSFLSVDIWSFCVCMCELANQHPPNRENIKRAMFLTATVGLARFFDEPELWSKSFEVEERRKGRKEDGLDGWIGVGRWDENGKVLIVCIFFLKYFLQSFLHWGSVFDPADRPTATSLLSHPFLNCACDKKNIKDKLQAIFLDDNLKVFV